MKQTVDWHSHWTRKSPGFHEGQVNRYLEQFLDLYSIEPGDTIFMPLCGKSVDIYWLSQHDYKVVGVELSEVAILAFFEESNLDFVSSRQAAFTVYKAHNITLYQGDFMHLQAQDLSDCKLVYDRASIVAIESFNRQTYKQKMLQIIPQGTPMLVITLEYDQDIIQGPPFSVPLNEIISLYSPPYSVEILQKNELIDERPKWREQGLLSFTESAYRLSVK